jgi:scyllo-inositol 2-dehydrogenase (NADP+)
VPDLRVAIVGYGLSGRFFHAPLIAATEGLAVATVVTSNADRQAVVTTEHPAARVVTSADELWAGPAHDLVVVATPPDAHAELAMRAIERGIPVVVDKPIAPNAGEAEALVERAERAGSLLTVFQNRRWDSDHLTLKRLIDDDRLGAVIRYESRFERWRPAPDASAWREADGPAAGGGQLLDLGSHLVDQALQLFGPATHIYAEVDARRGSPGDDDAFIALRLSGVISHLRISAVTAAPGPRLRVLGTKSSYVIEHLDSQEDRLRAGQRPDTVPDWGVEPASHWGRLVTGEDSTPVASEPGDWPRFYSQLAGAIPGDGSIPVDPRDAIEALRVLDAARRSAAERIVIELDA